MGTVVEIVGIVVAVISGILLPIYLSNRKPGASCAKFSYSLGTKRKLYGKDVTLAYDSVPVERITVTRFAVWNSSFTDIKQEIFPNDYPVKFTIKNGGKIIHVRKICDTETENEFVPKKISNETVGVKMKHMNCKDGFVVEIVHDGSAEDISASCNLYGGKKIKLVGSNDGTYKRVDPDQKVDQEQNGKWEKFGLILYWVLWMVIIFLFVVVLIYIVILFLIDEGDSIGFDIEYYVKLYIDENISLAGFEHYIVDNSLMIMFMITILASLAKDWKNEHTNTLFKRKILTFLLIPKQLKAFRDINDFTQPT